MIGVVIGIHYKPTCCFPLIPMILGDSSTKNLTSFVDADIGGSIFLLWIKELQPVKNLCWWFWFLKLGPSNNNSTGRTNGFNAIKSVGRKIMFANLFIFLSFIMRLIGSRVYLRLPLFTFSRSLKNPTNSFESWFASVLLKLSPSTCMCLTCISTLDTVFLTINNSTDRTILNLMGMTIAATTRIKKISTASFICAMLEK